MSSQVVPIVCLVVDNIATVSRFIFEVFECSETIVLETPCKYAVTEIIGATTIITIQKSTCDAAALASFGKVSAKQVFVAVPNPQETQQKAVKFGGQIKENCIDSNGVCMSVFEGPEQIVFNIVSTEKNSKKPAHELFMKSLISRTDEDNEVEMPIPTAPSNNCSNVTNSPRTNAPASPTLPRKSRRPDFKTLDVKLLSNQSQSFVPSPPNSRTATPFETEFFKGTAMLLIKTYDPPDPEFLPFFQGKRMFEVQVQGKFKRAPAGEIYVGAESTIKMELGIITRSVCRAVLRFVGTMVSNTHYAFGDNTSNPDYELPHLVAPLFPTMDKIVVTPPGGTPPPMGIPFVEDPDFRKHRCKSRTIAECPISLENVYSFSVNTSNMDLPNWNMVGVPMVNTMDLCSFFGDASIRLVSYEVPQHLLKANNVVHPQKDVNYVFNMKISPIDPSKNPKITGTSDSEYDDDDDDEDTPLPPARSPVRSALNGSPPQDGSEEPFLTRQTSSLSSAFPLVVEDNDAEDEDQQDNDSGDDDEGDEREEEYAIGDDDEEDLLQRPSLFPNNWKVFSGKKQKGNSPKKRSFLGRKILGKESTAVEDTYDADGGSGDNEDRPVTSTNKEKGNRNPASQVTHWIRTKVGEFEVADVTETAAYQPIDFQMELDGDSRYCPAVIDVFDHRKEGSRRILFLIPLLVKDSRANTVLATNSCRLLSYTELSRIVSLPAIPKYHKNKKLTLHEKRRKQIVESMKNIKLNHFSPSSAAPAAPIPPFLLPLTDGDKNFLGSQPVVQKGKDRWEGIVCIALSRRFWSEEYLVLAKTELTIQRSGGDVSKRHVAEQIPLSSIIMVKTVLPETMPLPGFSFFEVQTVSRVFTFMVRLDRQMNDWVHAFITLLGPGICPTSSLVEGNPQYTNMEKNNFLEGDQVFIAKPNCTWKLGKHRIFNYRRICFNSTPFAEKYRNMTPCELVEDLLQKAFTLSKEGNLLLTNRSRALAASQPAQAQDSNKLSRDEISLVELWVNFNDELSLLQIVNLATLNTREHICFFLNLYHLMILHGQLILGPPPSWGSWQSFFSSVSYKVQFDIFSIAEIEHNVLRAAMSKPAVIMTKLSVPNTRYVEFESKQRDFRLNFCLNNGSITMPSQVPIYQAATLDRQLDEMTYLMLKDSVSVDTNRRTVVLPKVCSWYQADFCVSRGGSVPSSISCINAVVHYLRGNTRLSVSKLLTDSSSVNTNHPIHVKYRNFNPRCRAFQQYFGEAADRDEEGV